MLFNSYHHWYEFLPGVWIDFPLDPDQRPDWSDMKNRYGSKSTMNWAGAHEDLSAYDLLLGHAQNLNLEAVWLYQQLDATDDYSDNNVSTFSYYAWIHGFLRRFIRKWYDVYECTCIEGCYEWPPSDCWTYIGSEPTNILSEE